MAISYKHIKCILFLTWHIACLQCVRLPSFILFLLNVSSEQMLQTASALFSHASAPLLKVRLCISLILQASSHKWYQSFHPLSWFCLRQLLLKEFDSSLSKTSHAATSLYLQTFNGKWMITFDITHGLFFGYCNVSILHPCFLPFCHKYWWILAGHICIQKHFMGVGFLKNLKGDSKLFM